MDLFKNYEWIQWVVGSIVVPFIIYFLSKSGKKIINFFKIKQINIKQKGGRNIIHIGDRIIFQQPSKKDLKKEDEGQRDKITEEIIAKRFVKTLVDGQMWKRRCFILLAHPTEKWGELKSLFTSEEGSIKKKLENPPLNAGKVRESGWDFKTLDQARIIKGEFIRVKNPTKIIDLYKDGTLIFVGAVDENFLTWNSKDELGIHPVGLIELVYNFVSFYLEVINDFKTKPLFIEIKTFFLNMHLNNRKNYLKKGSLKEYGVQSIETIFEAPENNYELQPIKIKTENFNKEELPVIAYQIIEKIYLWFGISLDKGNIPYTKTENGKTIVDIDQIRNI